MMTLLQALLFVLVALGGTAVVFTRDPRRQLIVFILYGSFLTLLFMTLQAPDVVLSQLAVGTALVPLMILAALVSIRGETRRKQAQGERAEGTEAVPEIEYR
jgi:energy-converting hydrogenase B subunit D